MSGELFALELPEADPYRYLTWLFTKLPLAKTVDDYDALLPWKMPVPPHP